MSEKMIILAKPKLQSSSPNTIRGTSDPISLDMAFMTSQALFSIILLPRARFSF